MEKLGFLPTAGEGWRRKKEQFMKLLEQEQPWTQMAQVYSNAIEYCDRKALECQRMYRRVLLMVVLVNVLVILSILTSGCGTLAGLQSDLHQITRSSMVERGQ